MFTLFKRALGYAFSSLGFSKKERTVVVDQVRNFNTNLHTLESPKSGEVLYAGTKRTVEIDLGCIGEAGARFSIYGGRVLPFGGKTYQ
jgi:hypothetical protein